MSQLGPPVPGASPVLEAPISLAHVARRKATPARAAPGGRSRPWPLLGAAGPTALIVVLVLYRLGARSIWLDEGFTFAAASQHGSALLAAALKDGGTALSYYIGMHFWMELFGSTEFALRLPTAIAAIGAVPVCFAFLERLFDRRAALFGATFVAASVGFVFWSQNARAYVVAVFFVCCSMLALVCAVQGRGRRAWAAYAVLTALAIYTLVLSVLVVVAQVLSLLVVGHWRDLPKRQLGFSLGAIALLGAPLVWVFVDHGTGAASWIAPPGPLFDLNNRYLFDFLASTRSVGVPYSPVSVGYLTVATVVCWALAGGQFAYRLATRRTEETTWAYGLLFAWFTLPPALNYLISDTVQPLLSDRYIIDALPAASMVIGVALSRLRPWPLALAAALVMAVWRVSLILPGYGVSLENWRQGVTEVVARAQPHDCIAFFVADGYSPFDYYVEHSKDLPGPVPAPVLPDAPWSSRGAYALDPEAVPISRWPRVVASCPRLWLLRTHAVGAPPGHGVLAYRVREYRASVALQAELSSSYRAEPTWWFRGVHVFLYVRRGQVGQGRPADHTMSARRATSG
ncbi:MAG TPA: glycosyltransferase family 39 protein [Acidimicrobiales bacterium]|nr:glycosyltransferase family 39 protein [Acidimicrobiales bacterium]